MPRGRKKKLEVVEEAIVEEAADVPVVVNNTRPSEKEKLQDLYQQLRDLQVHSIGDLEIMISRL